MSAFVEMLQRQHPRLAGITLSSTHLPWLKHFFEQADPRLKLFDPADEVTEQFRPLVTAGNSKLVTLVTQSPQHPFHEFQATLDRLTLDLQPRLVQI